MIALAALILAPAALVARPGGGESYSGGGHSGGGDGGGGGAIFFLLRLWIEFVIRYPQLGIPLTIVIAVVFIQHRRRKQPEGTQHWDSRPAAVGGIAAPPLSPASHDLDQIRQLDADFSVVLFEDFAYALYARAQEARAIPPDLAALAPYLSEAARRHLAGRAPIGVPVTAVVIGALRVLDLALPVLAAGGGAAPAAPRPRVEILLEFESNLTTGAAGAAGGQSTQYLRERWRLVRDAGVRSKPPEAVKSFHCPHCGAPFEPAGGGERCQYCGEVVAGGRFDWSVESIAVMTAENRPPALTDTVAEVGTDFPTVFHPAVASRRAELLRADPAATDAALAARLQLIYDQLNAAWTGLDLAPARPYVSDGLFDYLQYWIAAYRSQGLRNVLEGMRMTESTLTKVISDKHFDAVTFRIWGTGRDSTVRQATGQVVAGDARKDRPYSEYWTLIRGATVRGAPRADKSCPNCGAPLTVNMAGQCQHCGAKVTSGDFDWVLSKIEQDDSYSG